MSVFESYWANKAACDDAERAYYEKLSGCKSVQAEVPAAKKEGGSASEEETAAKPGLNLEKEFYHPGFGPHFGPIQAPSKNPRRARQGPVDKGPQGGGKKLGLSEQIDQARQLIKNSLECVDGLVSASGSSEDMALVKKLNALEVENKQLKKVTDDLKALVLSLEARVGQLEGGKPAAKPAPAKPAPAKPAPAEEEDDDVDLFGSSDEEESEEKKRITEERLKAYHEKKAKKPQVIAKTSVLLDVKPWDDETDHDQMLASVKSIEMDGLLWGAHKLIPIGYGIKKLQVMCTVEDEKVSVEELTEKIEEFEDFVQSCDVNAMNKI